MSIECSECEQNPGVGHAAWCSQGYVASLKSQLAAALAIRDDVLRAIEGGVNELPEASIVRRLWDHAQADSLARANAGWEGLRNLYKIITGLDCDVSVALGMATSAVAGLIRRAEQAERDESERLRQAAAKDMVVARREANALHLAHEKARGAADRLARLGLQSQRYVQDPDYRDAVDAALSSFPATWEREAEAMRRVVEAARHALDFQTYGDMGPLVRAMRDLAAAQETQGWAQ